MNRRQMRFKVTKPEKQMMTFLDMLCVKYEHEHFIPGVGTVDFYAPEHGVAVEVDGEYWHGTPAAQFRDRWKDAALAARGIQTVRVPSKEVLTTHEFGGQKAWRRVPKLPG